LIIIGNFCFDNFFRFNQCFLNDFFLQLFSGLSELMLNVPLGLLFKFCGCCFRLLDNPCPGFFTLLDIFINDFLGLTIQS
jgi:hypothetical protein